MKIDYYINHKGNKKFDHLKWLEDIDKSIKIDKLKKWVGDAVYVHYQELLEEFNEFINSLEVITDKEGNQLNPIQIYNAIEYYKIRFEKLLLIFNLKLYQTFNVNKDTKVRYIVMRAFWIDEKGKKYRYFSKNLGAENKVLINGKIPVNIMESVEDYILVLMWDLYIYEYFEPGEFGVDLDGNIVIPYD